MKHSTFVEKRQATWLFVNLESRQAIAVYNPSFEKIQELDERGFVLAWDSAPNAKQAYEYAENYCDGYQHACCECGQFLPVVLVTGQRHSDAHGRWIVLNGARMCDQCISSGLELGVLKVTRSFAYVPQNRRNV